MDTYKLRPKWTKINTISKENFEKDTGKLEPYYQVDRDSQYAVCPACDNPISIIGLYNPNTKSDHMVNTILKQLKNWQYMIDIDMKPAPMQAMYGKIQLKMLNQK